MGRNRAWSIRAPIHVGGNDHGPLGQTRFESGFSSERTGFALYVRCFAADAFFTQDPRMKTGHFCFYETPDLSTLTRQTNRRVSFRRELRGKTRLTAGLRRTGMLSPWNQHPKSQRRAP